MSEAPTVSQYMTTRARVIADMHQGAASLGCSGRRALGSSHCTARS